ncbi:hypothetical protein Desdi_0534 [Desulfitobacterium dichloroeliminans LMG P-21439]|uniref:DUF1643 domain-containing protein n=1 Tax=Desulfitobacterium dichloroeliminans (strain LMG P-21439 / DCA1) TaxID=871963 RepID=L0F2L7_DESDL|nr:DUF1643 domain-containing protein [Desulfitobacterium dichloroeliminans]AGA68069.1 hypothetical protein Desdi_0534 [Desulfitobacterium dichloroeliminans LMG P-21439]
MRNYNWGITTNVYEGDDIHKRFVLGVSGNNPLICFGINPSTANNQYADKTLHMVEKIANLNGYDGWLMLNIYPQRTTDPNGLDQIRNEEWHIQNLQHITTILKCGNLSLWAAWGKPIMTREYLVECLGDINDLAIKYSCRWIAFGKEEGEIINCVTVEGHPRHPSRLPLASRYIGYEVAHYFR